MFYSNASSLMWCVIFEQHTATHYYLSTFTSQCVCVWMFASVCCIVLLSGSPESRSGQHGCYVIKCDNPQLNGGALWAAPRQAMHDGKMNEAKRSRQAAGSRVLTGCRGGCAHQSACLNNILSLSLSYSLSLSFSVSICFSLCFAASVSLSISLSFSLSPYPSLISILFTLSDCSEIDGSEIQ